MIKKLSSLPHRVVNRTEMANDGSPGSAFRKIQNILLYFMDFFLVRLREQMIPSMRQMIIMKPREQLVSDGLPSKLETFDFKLV